MHIILWFTLLLTSAAIASDEIIPLKVGNKWSYQDQHGNTETAEVLGSKVIDGQTWFKYRELSDDDIYWVRSVIGKGQLEVIEELDLIDVALPYPVEKAMTFMSFEFESYVKPNIDIVVPAGSFSTYFYDFSDAEHGGISQMWIAPGVGLVKSRYRGEDQQEEVYELVSYKLK